MNKRFKYQGNRGNNSNQKFHEGLDLLLELFTDNYNKAPVKLKSGDIVGLPREQSLTGTNYEHYGIYTGSDRIIHYSSHEPGFTLDLEIMETSFKEFIKSNKDFFVLNFDHLKNPVKSKPISTHKLSGIFCPNCSEVVSALLEIREMLQRSRMKIYSPEETVKRARSRLGEKNYNLLLNNCEHFVIWCKTGLSKSYQIEKLLKVLKPEKGIL